MKEGGSKALYRCFSKKEWQSSREEYYEQEEEIGDSFWDTRW
jgi:hypothetical protein